MSDNCRQHYRMATGENIGTPAKTPGNPGFAKGGHVKPAGFKKGHQNAAGSFGHKRQPGK